MVAHCNLHGVLSRDGEYITININESKSCISVDKVKLAFVFHDLLRNTDNLDINKSTVFLPPVSDALTNKSSRRVRFLQRLITEINYDLI